MKNDLNVFISSKLQKSITSSGWRGPGVCGFLVGDVRSQASQPHLVLGVWQCRLADSSELKEEAETCLSHFSGGRNVAGIVLVLKSTAVKSFEDEDEAGIDREFEETLGDYSLWLEQLELTPMIVLSLWRPPESDQHWRHSCFLLEEDSFVKATLVQDIPSRPTCRFRVKANLPLLITTESGTEEQLKMALDSELIKLQNQAQNGDIVFGFDSNRIIIQSKDVIVAAGGVEWTLCRDISKHFLEQEASGGATSGGGGKRKTQQQPHSQPLVPVSLLLLSSIESAASLQYAPIIRHNIGEFKTTSLVLPLDVLVEVDEQLPISELSDILNDSVTRQIFALFQCLSKHVQNGKLYTPQVFHLKPNYLDTAVTVVYPKGVSDSELEFERRRLLESLCLPLDQPLLRRGAAGYFLRQTAPGGYLINTHLGLPDPPDNSGSVWVVDGFYSYHHYMQDHFDDDKWGCAYRSLQTLVSWFKYQGYTDRDIPSHRDIQQALFEIGDKEQKFVGSRQWIGSFEVSYVLDHLLGVTSKFINVNSGAELSTVGQALSNHFQTQGTPVMIGGGVLAHTILGVAYNEVTGDLNFLILDPHYTGSEDLRIIQDKGWCGWKDLTFWNQTAHYNMCLPQRPSCI